jgi:hypothetical protein
VTLRPLLRKERPLIVGQMFLTPGMASWSASKGGSREILRYGQLKWMSCRHTAGSRIYRYSEIDDRDTDDQAD